MAAEQFAEVSYRVKLIHSDGNTSPVSPDQPLHIRQPLHPVGGNPYLAEMTYGLGQTTISLLSQDGKSDGGDPDVIVGDGGMGAASAAAFMQVRDGDRFDKSEPKPVLISHAETAINFDAKYFRPVRRRKGVLLEMVDSTMRRAVLSGKDDFVEFALSSGTGNLPSDVIGISVERTPIHKEPIS